MYRYLLSLLLIVLLGVSALHAQEGEEPITTDSDEAPADDVQETISSLGERTSLLETEVEKLRAIRISGYIQVDWMHFDQSTTAGGRVVPGYFDARKNFFTVRRGRLKVQHRLGDLMSYTIQPDITESGVTIKDAYATFHLLPMEELSVNVGMFNRPNFEVELSSSARESPERSQIVRAFYPGERDLGVMFSSRQSLFENFDPKLQVGLFNGVGTAAETDAYKDLFARLVIPLPLGGESPVQIDLGGSYYHGGIPQTDSTIIRTVDGKNSTVANDETGDMAGWGNRSNWGVESQIFLDLLPFGGTIIRGELLSGIRPTAAVAGVARDSVNFRPAVAARPLQLRDQMGFYLYFIQNIGTELQIAAKYDLFDRNTNLSGTEVTSASEAASSVLGFGMNAFIDNLRITLWYEIPRFAADENIQLASGQPSPELRTVDVKDNKTTIRFQYKF